VRCAAVILLLLLSGCAPLVCNCKIITEPYRQLDEPAKNTVPKHTDILYDHPLGRLGTTGAGCVINVKYPDGTVIQWNVCVTVPTP